MCGIIHVQRNDNKPAGKNVFKRYKKQVTRGSDGFGYIAIDGDRKIRVERFVEEDDVKKALLEEKSSNIIFHHRFPTSTENIKELNHPILVHHKELKCDYYVVHNGVITNEDDLFEDHGKLGYIYNTLCEIQKVYKVKGMIYEENVDTKFNDSESLAIELARYFEGLSDEINTCGNVAFIAVKVNKKSKKAEEILTGRNYGNPLTVEDGGNLMCVRSEGGKTELAPNIVTRQDLKTNAVSIQEARIGCVYRYATTPNYTTHKGQMGYTYTDPNEYKGKPTTHPNHTQQDLKLGGGTNVLPPPRSPYSKQLEITDEDIEDIYTKTEMEDFANDIQKTEDYILYQAKKIEDQIISKEQEIEELEESIEEYPQYKYAFEEQIATLNGEISTLEVQQEEIWDEAMSSMEYCS